MSLFDHLGKQYLKNEIIKDIIYENNKVIINQDNKFKVYDKNLKLLKESKNYNNIVSIMKDYIITLDNNKLQLINTQDELVTTFIDNYDTNRYKYHPVGTGWNKYLGKEAIFIIIEDKNIDPQEVYDYYKNDEKHYSLEELQNLSLGYNYHYIPSTKGTGKIPIIIWE